jgi:hypothetical protein
MLSELDIFDRFDIAESFKAFLIYAADKTTTNEIDYLMLLHELCSKFEPCQNEFCDVVYKKHNF